ncbi:MAG: hypothetical protein KDB02_10995 [Acidimicrobiales bacterium]|nr:hypothetical protein [Acidimicrobiales bacterium]
MTISVVVAASMTVAISGWAKPATGDAAPALELSPTRTEPGSVVTLSEDDTFDMYCGVDGETRTATWELVRSPLVPETNDDDGPVFYYESPGVVVDSGSVEVTAVGPWSTTVTIPADGPAGSAYFARGQCLDESGNLVFGYYYAIGTVAGVAPTTTTVAPAPVTAAGAPPVVASPTASAAEAEPVTGVANFTG